MLNLSTEESDKAWHPPQYKSFIDLVIFLEVSNWFSEYLILIFL